MADPIEEWQRLTRLYAEMGEIELRELVDGFSDLTETAQQVLRDEMRKRDLGDPRFAATMRRTRSTARKPRSLQYLVL